jgi:anti-anti-sigma regulatory factor/pSer/pThr/pTyr-binding forkhead associated (FHA) protein
VKFYLIVAKGKRRGLPIPIEIDLFLIGSAPMCQLRADHDDIGGQHCAFAVRGKKVVLRDLGSGKATVVNGEVMPGSEEWPLHKGDHIAVGPLEFRINFHEKQLSQRDLEEWALKQLDEDSGPKVSALEEIDAVNRAEVDHDDASSVASAIISRLNAQKGVLRGRLRISQEGTVTLVRIQDVYLVDDAELVHLRKELHDNLSHPNLRVLLDFKNVRRMSTAAAELFGETVDWLRRFGSSLAMCRLRPELASMMKGMQSIYSFRLFPDKETALKQRW